MTDELIKSILQPFGFKDKEVAHLWRETKCGAEFIAKGDAKALRSELRAGMFIKHPNQSIERFKAKWPTCATCRHHCNRSNKCHKLAKKDFGIYSTEQQIWTYPTFGCIHHEEHDNRSDPIPMEVPIQPSTKA